MQFLKKIRIPLIILILLILVVLSIIIVRNILTVAGHADDALDFASEMPTNLDDIFTSDFSNEDVSIDTQVNTNQVAEFSADETITTTDNSAVDVPPAVVMSKEQSEQTDTSSSVAAQADNTELVAEIVPEQTTTVYQSLEKEKEVSINRLIVDKYTASKKSPSYITIVAKGAPGVVYADVKVFARRLGTNNEILSRDLVFALPRVYVVNGQAQTQFYFAGRYAGSRKYIRDGRYIMYIEVIGYDKDGNRISGTGGYPMPQFDNVITLKN